MTNTFFEKKAIWQIGVRQLETSDPVLGGPDGVSNIAPRQLSERTDFLLGALELAFGEFKTNTGALPKKLTLPASSGGTGLSTITNGSYLRGGANNTIVQVSLTQLKRDLKIDESVTSLRNDLNGKANASHKHQWSDIDGKPTTFPATAHSHSWDSITGKPTTFPVTAHRHNWSEIDGKPDVVIKNANQEITGITTFIGGGNDWSRIRLKTKQGFWDVEVNPDSHLSTGQRLNFLFQNTTDNTKTYIEFPTTGGTNQSVAYQSWVNDRLHWNNLQGKPSTFTPSGHTHTWSQVTGKPTTLSGYGITNAITTVVNRPSTKTSGNVIYVESLRSLMYWQTIGSWSGYATRDLGELVFGTTKSRRLHEIDLVGSTFSKSAYPALWAWIQANEHLIAANEWRAGMFKFVDVNSTTFRAPDLRNVFIRGTGTDADSANARALGSYQGDAIRNITGTLGRINAYHTTSSGAISFKSTPRGSYVAEGANETLDVTFDASKSVPTAKENRPINVALVLRLVSY